MLTPGRFGLLFFVVVSVVRGTLFDPSPAFPVPSWTNGAHDLRHAFDDIEAKLKELAVHSKFDAASFSVAVTSETETLWDYFHTARKRNETRPGVPHVDGDSLYRIASITKTFTVLGLLYQHQGGRLDLDTPISKYIPELSGEIAWHEITLRALASQLSGIPREFGQGDMLNAYPEPWKIGLPPVSRDGLPVCDEYHNYDPPCTPEDLIEALKSCKPVFAPNQQSTYSNVNYELIGIAIERAVGMKFEDYMQEAIFDPLEMELTTIKTPSDEHAVLPVGDNYWDVDEGVQNPTGGIYSSSNDMSKFLRHILTHYNAIATGVNWLMPASWATGMENFYGTPFEIFRTDKILTDSQRPVTFATKGGGLPGYVTLITAMPEYGLGITVLVGCDTDCSTLLTSAQEIVSVNLVRAAEQQIWKNIEKKYAGYYSAENSGLNSSLSLNCSSKSGLVITSFISNGTDVLNQVLPGEYVDDSREWRVQLVPTSLFKNESSKEGEIWRGVPAYERDPDRGIWDSAGTTDIEGPLVSA
jgi:CubicO group peptidase (beta-lactamase class C family)